MRAATSCTVSQLRELGFAASEVVKAGGTAAEMRELGYTAADLREADVGASEVASAGYSLAEIGTADSDAPPLRGIADFLKQESVAEAPAGSEQRLSVEAESCSSASNAEVVPSVVSPRGSDGDDGDELEALKSMLKQMEDDKEMLEALLKSEADEGLVEEGAEGAEKDKEADSRSVYVSQVHYSATPKDLHEHFAGAGTMNRVTIFCDQHGNPKGYARIEFDTPEAMEAAKMLNESDFKGRRLKVVAAAQGDGADIPVREIEEESRTSSQESDEESEVEIDVEVGEPGIGPMIALGIDISIDQAITLAKAAGEKAKEVRAKDKLTRDPSHWNDSIAHQVGGEYLEPLLSAVGALDGDSPVKLLDARVLIALASHPKGRLVRRQDMPHEAFINLDRLRLMPRGAALGLRIICVSYPWYAPLATPGPSLLSWPQHVSQPTPCHCDAIIGTSPTIQTRLERRSDWSPTS